MVRYADDFVVVCKSRRMAEQIKTELTEHLSKEIGLALSVEKTNITHITKGFNFLGFNIRKYPKQDTKKPKADRDWGYYTLLIKPQKEKVIEFLRGCKEVLNDNKTSKQSSIIGILNPKLLGWSMYYRHVVSKVVFGHVDKAIWNKLFHWAKRRHPKKSKSWVLRRYFSKVGNVRLTFKDHETGTYIDQIARIPIKRHVMVNGKYRVYDKNPTTQEYWKKREYTNAYNQIKSVKLSRLYKRQEGKCSYCKEIMRQEQVLERKLHVHHVLPRSLNGTEGYSNLRLLHNECHRELHANISRKEMKELSINNVDYFNT
jgi:RNA-directed DNA polymerase